MLAVTQKLDLPRLCGHINRKLWRSTTATLIKINVIIVDVLKRPDRKKGSLTSSVPTGIYVVLKIRIM